jgi:hypothetical protein
MKQANLFFGFFGIALVLLFALFNYTSKHTLTVTTGHTVASSTSPLSSYNNATYHFSLQYPKTFTLQNSFSPFHYLGTSWRTNAPQTSTGTPLFEIVTYTVNNSLPEGNPYPLFYKIAVRGGVSGDTHNCLLLQNGEQEEKELVTFGDTPWHVVTFSDAAMMQFVSARQYRTIHNNLCYTLEQVSAGSHYKDSSMTEGKSDEELQKMFTAGFDIIKTFAFTKE